MKKNNLVTASLVMLIFSIVSKISGFLRELVFAYFYGASNVTDAYITATAISTTIFAGITLAVSTGYMPTISSVDKSKISHITSNIMNVVVIIIVPISIVCTLFIDDLIPFFATGFTEETRMIAADMARIILLPASFLYAIYNILNGYMQFKHIFWTVGVATVINNLVNMVAFAVSGGNLNVLSIGYVLSWILPTLFLLIVAKKQEFFYRFVAKVNDDSIKTIIKMGIPIFIGQFIFQFNTLVDRNFSSTLGEGVMTSMKYANQLILFVITIFVISIVTAIYPTLSKLSVENNFDEYKKISGTSMNTILLFVLPVTTAFVILARPIVELVFMRGEFDAQAAKVTSDVLMVYALGLPAISLNEILNKQFYSLKDTKTPVVSNAVSLMVNIGMNFMLIGILGYVGLALATATANTVLAILLYYRLQKKIGNLGTKKLAVNFIKMTSASVLMGGVVILVLKAISNITAPLENVGNMIEIAISGLIGGTIYFTLIYIFKVQELKTSIDYIKTKISKKKA